MREKENYTFEKMNDIFGLEIHFIISVRIVNSSVLEDDDKIKDNYMGISVYISACKVQKQLSFRC